jgi:hypothetical protein
MDPARLPFVKKSLAAPRLKLQPVYSLWNTGWGKLSDAPATTLSQSREIC